MTSKSHTHATTAAALALGMLAHGAAQAVVEAGHWRYSGSASGIQGSNFNVHVDQNQAQDYTGVFLKYANGVLQGVTYNVDEGADIFVVQPGTAFTAAWGNQHPEAFLMGTSKERSSGPDDRQLTPATGGIKVGTDFYLGVQTRSGTYTGFTVFGWAHFKKDVFGQIQMVDSAMAFDEEGIVVGQLQAVNTAIDSSVFKVSTSTPSLFSPAPIGNPTRDPQLNIDVPFDGGISWGTQFAYKRPAKLSSTFSRELRILRTLLSADGQWFVVQPGDVISASTVADGSLKPMAMPKGGLPATSVTVGRDVWLGLALKESSPIPPETDRIHYGWLHLRFNLFGTPTLVDSVYTRRENGIVVGQKTRCAVCQP